MTSRAAGPLIMAPPHLHLGSVTGAGRRGTAGILGVQRAQPEKQDCGAAKNHVKLMYHLHEDPSCVRNLHLQTSWCSGGCSEDGRDLRKEPRLSDSARHGKSSCCQTEHGTPEDRKQEEAPLLHQRPCAEDSLTSRAGALWMETLRACGRLQNIQTVFAGCVEINMKNKSCLVSFIEM
ncbi:hypothetical protein PBY51_025016 [Eleginops maclovinus]|uniref:Uncharacterized protein n=1 Tax=Eleginops maclovinus TaxID=56733 RepID=A0AAN7Y0L9_ELEMC|nr:hypothetical protein PBY51_025016 [Eleginops maclovinus]